MSYRLWGGRFEDSLDDKLLAFTRSIAEDRKLWRWDIKASQAHARMLGKTGIIPIDESLKIMAGLEQVQNRIVADGSIISEHSEDIHSEIERLLVDEIGKEIAGKLHTARSRNDHAVTLTRLETRSQLREIEFEIISLIRRVIAIAEVEQGTILPAVTHMQHAQPTTLAHHLLAYAWMWERDLGQLRVCIQQMSRSPLGACACSGTTFPIDRVQTASELELEEVIPNSLDAVSDRDFVLNALHVMVSIQLHLSRLADEWVLWSTPEFNYLTLSDKVTTGSSIMPQKKNPDVAELIRGRVGRVIGAYTGMAMTLKGLPLGYHRDLQEDKWHLFQAIDTVKTSVLAMGQMFEGIKFHREKMRDACEQGFLEATDIADYLVTQGIPFREAHQRVGEWVRLSMETGRTLREIAVKECGKQIGDLISVEGMLKGRGYFKIDEQIEGLRRRIVI